MHPNVGILVQNLSEPVKPVKLDWESNGSRLFHKESDLKWSVEPHVCIAVG